MKYMRALCYKCGHSWNYKGKTTEGKGYITCSGCYYKIRADKALDFSSQEHQKLLTTTNKLLSLPKKIPTTHYSESYKPHPKAPIVLEIVEFKNIADFLTNIDLKGTIKITEIKSDRVITEIPYDIMKHIKHMENF